MNIKPIETFINPKTLQKLKFISAYEPVPTKTLSPVEVVVDKFIAHQNEALKAPTNVLDSVQRVSWYW